MPDRSQETRFTTQSLIWQYARVRVVAAKTCRP